MASKGSPTMVVGFAALALAAGPSWAGGQYAGDNGSLAAQRAGAFTARADDPTALYYNPAALFRIGDHRQVFLGVNLVSFDQSFQRDGSYRHDTNGDDPTYAGDPYPTVHNDGPVQPVPFVAAAFTTGKLALAIGVFAPHGYGTRNYPDSVRTVSGAQAPAPQRYDIISQQGVIALPSAGFAYPIKDGVTVGARASYGFAHLQTRRFAQGLANRAELSDRDTDATIDVSDNKIITWGAGIHVHTSPGWELGASYSAPIEIHARGTADVELGDLLRNIMPGQETQIVPVPDAMAQCAPGGAVGAIKTCLDMALPQTAQAGLRWINRDDGGRELGDLEIDVRWENWSAVDKIVAVMDGQNSTVAQPVNPSDVRHGFEDVYSARLGGSRVFGDQRQYMASFGLGYESAAAPTSWTRLDVDTAPRFSASGGLSVDVGSFRVDAGVAIVDPADRHVYDTPVDQTNATARVQPDVPVPLQPADAQPYHPFNAGSYATRYLIASFGLTATW